MKNFTSNNLIYKEINWLKLYLVIYMVLYFHKLVNIKNKLINGIHNFVIL